MMASWMIWGALMGFPDQGDHTAMVSAISANAAISKWLMGLATLFVLLMAAGIAGLKGSMAGGSGSDYAAIGILIFLMSAAFGLGETALTIAAGDVGATGNAAVATTIYLAGNGIGAIATAGIFLGMSILGLGIYIQKNFNIILAVLLIASGLFGIVMTLYDYGNPSMIVGYAGMSLCVVAMGVSTLRASD